MASDTTVTTDQLLRIGAALALAGAGMIHLDAAGSHRAHLHVAAFFVLLAAAQLATVALLVLRPGRAVRWAVVGTTAITVSLWLVSRTTGVPLVPDVGAVEPVGVPDVMATALELAAVAALGLLAVLPAAARAAVVASANRAVGAVAASVLALTAPGLVAATHEHGGDGGHTDVAAAHPHTAAGGVVASGEDLVGHGHTGHLVEATAREVQLPPAAEHAHAQPRATGTGDAPVLPDLTGHLIHEEHSPHRPPPSTAAREDAPWHAAATEPAGVATSLRYGPFTLPPASSDDVRGHNALLTNVILTDLPKPCTDCLLTKLEPNLVYADGREANYDTGVMLHHNVMAQSWHDDHTCARDEGSIGFAGRRFFASGNERTVANFPPGFGLSIDDTPWTGIFEIMNHVDEPQTVYFQLSVRHVPADAKGMKPVTPIWLDVDNCEDSQFAVDAGRTVTDWDWTSTLTGRVVLTAGHVHDGGVSIELRNATTDRSMCRSVASYGTKPSYEGALDGMSACSWDRVGTVRAGEVLRISALYDTAEALPDVMGIMMAFVHETDDLAGGTDAPREMTHPPDRGAPPPSGHDH